VTAQREPDGLELLSVNSVMNGFRLSTRIMPAQGALRGGDWCETLAVSAHIVGLSIGDVCGHGPQAFEVMLTTRQALRDAVTKGLGPGRALARVNRTLCAQHSGAYVSAIFGLLDTHRHTLTFANAGHPPPLLTGPRGQQFLGCDHADLLLGIDANAVPAVHVVTVPADALLVLYTDGVTDGQRDASLGQEQLLHASSFAHHYSALSAAPVIERQMFLTGPNLDDAAILTARAPSLRMHGAQ
jgi:serine phosphatase RsbU (regulator of sigma subunit)